MSRNVSRRVLRLFFFFFFFLTSWTTYPELPPSIPVEFSCFDQRQKTTHTKPLTFRLSFRTLLRGGSSPTSVCVVGLVIAPEEPVIGDGYTGSVPGRGRTIRAVKME